MDSRYLTVCTLIESCMEAAVYWTCGCCDVKNKEMEYKPSRHNDIGVCRTHGLVFREKIRVLNPKPEGDNSYGFVVTSMYQEPTFMDEYTPYSKKITYAIWPDKKNRNLWWGGEKGKVATYRLSEELADYHMTYVKIVPIDKKLKSGTGRYLGEALEWIAAQ